MQDTGGTTNHSGHALRCRLIPILNMTLSFLHTHFNQKQSGQAHNTCNIPLTSLAQLRLWSGASVYNWGLGVASHFGHSSGKVSEQYFRFDYFWSCGYSLFFGLNPWR